jgi:hypothetical protein
MGYSKNILKWYKKVKAIKHLGGKCNICSDTDVRHLTFHHFNPDEKETTYWALSSQRWEHILEEINKCELLCHNCHNEYHYNLYKNYNSNKNIFLEYKGIKCKNCNYDKCSASLHFHHIDKTTKSFNLSKETKYSNYKSISDVEQHIIEELNKCDILCGNCHMELDVDNSAVEYVLENFDNIKLEHKTKKLDRILVYDMYNKNMKQADIARSLGVSKGTISGIIKDMKNNTL